MISKKTLEKIRAIVGPPGTGKTHIKIKKLYSDLYDKYGPERGIVLSHTRVAAAELAETITSIDKIKDSNWLKEDEDYFKYRICTIHSYAKKNSGQRREVFDKKIDYENLCTHVPMFNLKNGKQIKRDPQKNHPFFKCNSEAHGRGLDINEHWHTAQDPNRSYDPYTLKMILDMKTKYEKFKNDNHIQDYQDMLDSYIRKEKTPVIDFLIVDEAQDCNVPQMLAIERMAEHAKVVIMVGDPNQTIFKFAGANPDFFEKLFAKVKGEDELTKGLRCSKAINTFAKKIIKPIWDYYGYERVWLPTEEEGSVQFLPNLIRSQALQTLINKIKNSNESFLFTYRSSKSKEDWIIPFLRREGFKYRSLKNSNHVNDEELNAHYNWPSFIRGESQSLEQIQNYWKHLDPKYKLKDKRIFKKIINKSYTFKEFVNEGYLKEELKKQNYFYNIVKVPKSEDKKEKLKERLGYITRLIEKGNINQKSKVEYGNFHEVKGITRDNVIVDLSLTRDEDQFEQRRLGYVAVSRGKHDAWILKTQTGKELII